MNAFLIAFLKLCASEKMPLMQLQCFLFELLVRSNIKMGRDRLTANLHLITVNAYNIHCHTGKIIRDILCCTIDFP